MHIRIHCTLYTVNGVNAVIIQYLTVALHAPTQFIHDIINLFVVWIENFLYMDR